MTDIRTLNTAGPIGFAFDWGMQTGALAVDGGLETPIIISLFSDRVAAADDDLPDNSGDRRGWWGDVALDGGAADPIGSRLWLLARAKATKQTAAQAQRYALEALQWLKDDGVVGEISVAAEYVTREQLKLTVTVTRQVAGRQVNRRYDYIWNPAQPAAFVPALPPVLADADGTLLVDESGHPLEIF